AKFKQDRTGQAINFVARRFWFPVVAVERHLRSSSEADANPLLLFSLWLTLLVHSGCSRTLNSSFQRCLPSRLRHHNSSVPISVILLCRCTGPICPSLLGASSVVASGLNSSICPSHSSTIVPTPPPRPTAHPRKRNSPAYPP